MFLGFVCLGTVGADCGSKAPEELTRAYEPRSLSWEYLPIYQATVTLPALRASQGGDLSSACLKSLTPTTEPAADLVDVEYRDEKKISVGVKAALEAAIEKAGEGSAGLDLAAAKESMETWEVHIEGLQYSRVDPAEARPNFENSVCTTPELKWFTDTRDLVIGAVKATKITLSSSATLSAEVKAVLEAVFSESTGTAAGGGGIDFAKSSESDGSVKIVASDVYFAVRTTSLYAEMCQAPKSGTWKVKPGKDHEICGYTFSFAPTEADPNQYRLSIQRPMADTAEYLETFGKRKMRALDPVHLVGVQVKRDGKKYRASVAAILAGPQG